MLPMWLCEVYSQTIISGSVKVIDGTALDNANILLVPKNKDQDMGFAIADDKGYFSIKINQNGAYELTVSFLGYLPYKKTYDISDGNNISLDIILTEDVNELQEVELNYKPPMIIKKDTTIYDVDKFASGKERKLKEVLKKLPGIEVDRNGVVTHNGKKVTKVLVDDKQFFTGKSKMAVENIPADVVREIEIIDDYHETAFLKGLEDSDDLAMNIKLKSDRKNFIFGDIEAGSNASDRYILHPSLFKYGSKMTYNFIADLNTTEQKSFSISDYIGFEGGLTRDNASRLLGSDIVRFLRQNDFTDNRHQFAGLNLHFTPNERLELRSFGIALSDESDFKTDNTFEYFDDSVIEFRNEDRVNKNDIFLSKTRLKYSPDSNTTLFIENSLEVTDLNDQNRNESFLNNNLRQFDIIAGSSSTKNNLNVEANKKSSKAHTSSIKFNIRYDQNNYISNWLSADNLFSSNIPIDFDDEEYFIVQTNERETIETDYLLKHYWLINRKNHVYFSNSSRLLWQAIESDAFQNQSDMGVNDFEGYDNDLNTNLFYSFSEIEYKRLVRDFIFQVKLRYEHYNWKLDQIESTTKNSASFLIPGIKINYDINKNQRLELSYRQSSNLVDFINFLENSRITSFNSTIIGNPDLRLNYIHNFSLGYRGFKTYGFSYFPKIGYRIQEGFVASNAEFDGIFSERIPLNLQNNNTTFYARFRTLWNKPYWKATFVGEYDFTNINTFLSGEEIKNELQTINSVLEFNTKFEEFPNFDLSLRSTMYINENQLFSNTLRRDVIYAATTHNFGDFQFKADYERTFFQNDYTLQTNSTFDNLNCSIYYRKEDNPWGYELRFSNLTDNKFRQNSTFDNTLLQEEKIFVFPRLIMFLISYKL